MKLTTIPTAFRMLITIALVLNFLSCDRMHEHLQPCDEGFRIRFIYDYNMEFANGFPSQVDCLTVLFFDNDGNYVTTRTENSTDLSDENWRMIVDLPAGEYTILAYGGMDCDKSSFRFVTDPQATKLQDVEVELKSSCLTSPEGTNLHPLFYGRLSAEIPSNSTHYTDVTVPMMKDTNNLRVILQQVDGSAIDASRFDFKVTDNNTLFAWDNNLLPQPTVTYAPWTKGNVSPGLLPNEEPVSAVFAEMSFPRLVTGSEARFTVTNALSGEKVIDIPLVNYLLLLKSEQFKEMPSQEFLDRESRWSMIFFLDRNHQWLQTQIVINDWVVRLNNPEL